MGGNIEELDASGKGDADKAVCICKGCHVSVCREGSLNSNAEQAMSWVVPWELALVEGTENAGAAVAAAGQTDAAVQGAALMPQRLLMQRALGRAPQKCFRMH